MEKEVLNMLTLDELRTLGILVTKEQAERDEIEIYEYRDGDTHT